MPHKRKNLGIKGPKLWYLVGLITSDGCLSSDGRHINITSEDYSFLRGLKKELELANRIGVKNRRRTKQAYQIQLANVNFYNFLLSIGLMQNKSLTLEQVSVPEGYFPNFLRGLIDGDGGMQRWIHPTNKREQWNLRIASGSIKFLEWLQDDIEKIIGVTGRLHKESPTRFRLKYGKMAARVIVRKCYHEGCFGLERKIALARACIDSYRGWKRSSTIL